VPQGPQVVQDIGIDLVYVSHGTFDLVRGRRSDETLDRTRCSHGEPGMDSDLVHLHKKQEIDRPITDQKLCRAKVEHGYDAP
jgi:hypothetical protein